MPEAGPEPPLFGQHICDDSVRVPPLNVRIHHIHISAALVLGQGDDGGEVAAFGLAQRWVDESEEVKGGIAEVDLGFVVVVEPLLHEQAVIRVDRLVLLFRIERSLAFRHTHHHQVIVGQLLLPQHLGALQHGSLVRLEEGQRVGLPVIVGQVGEDGFPLLPQIVCLGKADHRLVFNRAVGWVGQRLGQQAVIVQQGADINDVGIIVSALAHRLIKPILQLLALLRCAHILIILHIVQDDQVGPPVPMLPATDLLAAADGLDFDVGLGHQYIAAPHAARQRPKVLQDRGVLLELHPDVIQEALGLLRTVRDDDGIMLVAIQGGMHRPLEGQVGGLGVATGGRHCSAHPRQTADRLGVRCRQWIAPLQHALLPDCIQFPVKLRGGAAEVMREVGPSKEFHVDGSQLSTQALRPRRGMSRRKLSPKLDALRGVILI